jgi:CBS domain-containing protein
MMHAAGRIVDRGVNRLPVVDEDGRLLGVISRADVVRAFTRSDDEIAREVRGDIERILGLGPESVQVSVVDGEVSLAGEVDSDVNAKLAAFFASRTSGVVSVQSDLRAPESAD